jgi:hypothetical protein
MTATDIISYKMTGDVDGEVPVWCSRTRDAVEQCAHQVFDKLTDRLELGDVREHRNISYFIIRVTAAGDILMNTPYWLGEEVARDVRTLVAQLRAEYDRFFGSEVIEIEDE